MTKVLLSIHVLVAIITIGPVTVAASMFPAAARRSAAASDAGRDLADLRTLHRICRVYAAVGIVVPVFGFATASSLSVLRDVWLILSIVLTAVVAAVLVQLVLPRQESLLLSLTASFLTTPPAECDQKAPARWPCTPGCSTCCGPWSLC